MSVITLELQETLASLKPAEASALEVRVREVLNLFKMKVFQTKLDANGWPIGHFEKYAGSFANEPLEEPEDLPPESNEAVGS